MTPNFRELAEKIVREWVSLFFEDTPVYRERILRVDANMKSSLKDLIETALKQAYEQRPKVEIEWSNLDKVIENFPCSGINKCGDTEAGFYQCQSHWAIYHFIDVLKANTKIKEVENEKV